MILMDDYFVSQNEKMTDYAVYVTTGLLVISEVLPFLPMPADGILHVTLIALNKAKILPDVTFAKLTRNVYIGASKVRAINGNITPLVSANV